MGRIRGQKMPATERPSAGKLVITRIEGQCEEFRPPKDENLPAYFVCFNYFDTRNEQIF